MLRSQSSILALAFLLLPACGDSGETTAPQAASMGNLGQLTVASRVQAPGTVANEFFQALENDDQPAYEALLTHASVSALHAEGATTMSFSGKNIGTWAIGGTEIDGDLAKVAVTLDAQGTPQAMSLRLRREDESWRIFGASIPMGEDEWDIDFEGRSDDLLTQASNELAAGIAEGIGSAFQDAAADWKAGGSAEEIARKRASFDALAPVDMSRYSAGWRVNVNAVGRRASDVVGALLGSSGLVLASSDELDHVSNLSLSGVSRMEAIDALCAEFGLVPVYPDPQSWNGPKDLSFREGPRTRPVAFMGPFQVEVTALEEQTPNTTGSCTITVRALGLDSAMLAANEDMEEFLRIESLTSAAGEDLRIDPEAQWMGSPTVEGGLFTYSLSPELRGLVRGVESFSVSGEMRIALPTDVHIVEFESGPTEAPRRAGPWSVAWDRAGPSNDFTLTRGDHQDIHAGVRFAPDDASGETMGIQSESTYELADRLTANLMTPEIPSALSIKVFETEELQLAFQLDSIPLEHYGEQPLRTEPLSFAGDTPLSVEFAGFADRSDPDFPHVSLRASNGANLGVTDAQATFLYLDESGAVLKEFPHNLTGAFQFEGPQILAGPGETASLDTVAFFMPTNTDSLQVRIESVAFLNGSTWERE